MFRNQSGFFTVPRAVWERHLAELGGAELKLYLLLLGLAQKHSAVQIELPAYEVRDYTGLHAESVTIARRKLEEAGLVFCKKGTHALMTYELLNPETGMPLPAPEGRKGIRAHRRQPGRSARSARASASDPTVHTSNAPTVVPCSEIDADVGDGKSVSTTRKIRHLTLTKFVKTGSLTSRSAL